MLNKAWLEQRVLEQRSERHQKMLERLQVENDCLKVCIKVMFVLWILTIFLQVMCLVLWWVD